MVLRTVHDLQPVLYDPTLDSDTLVYQVEALTDGRVGDTTTIYPIMLGQEYPKTYGHYHVTPHSETYTVISGQALVVIQKLDVLGGLEDIQEIPLKAGESFTVPEGYGHVLINIGEDNLVTEDNWDQSWSKHDYESVTKHHGFAHYIVRGPTGPIVAKNPNYAFSQV